MGSIPWKISPSRDLIDDYADKLADDSLHWWSRSDVFWDRVVSVQPDGHEQVYQLSTARNEAWLADGIVTYGSVQLVLGAREAPAAYEVAAEPVC